MSAQPVSGQLPRPPTSIEPGGIPMIPITGTPYLGKMIYPSPPPPPHLRYLFRLPLAITKKKSGFTREIFPRLQTTKIPPFSRKWDYACGPLHAFEWGRDNSPLGQFPTVSYISCWLVLLVCGGPGAYCIKLLYRKNSGYFNRSFLPMVKSMANSCLPEFSDNYR